MARELALNPAMLGKIDNRASVAPRLPLPPGTPDRRRGREVAGLLGYRGLDQIHRQLEPILLRRTRKEVLKELPPRTDQVFYVPLTQKQAQPYWEQNEILDQLMHKWQRHGWLSERN